MGGKTFTHDECIEIAKKMGAHAGKIWAKLEAEYGIAGSKPKLLKEWDKILKKESEMGLDLSHECWHGAYSAFGRWREKLAEVAGYAVWNVAKAESNSAYQYFCRETIIIDWGHITDDNLQGHWEKIPDDPLMLIIAHSDCGGLIHWEHCERLAGRLKELLPGLPEGHGTGHIGNWRDTTSTFIDGLLLAHSQKEDVYFH